MKMGRDKTVLRFVTAGKSPRSALPLGNGKTGLLIFGGARRERIVVNDADLFWKGHTGVLPDISEKVKILTKKMLSSNFREAETVLTDALIAKKYTPEPCYPLPLCDFVLTNDVASDIDEYYRLINMQTAEAEVGFRDRDGRLTRNVFVDQESGIICMKIVGTNGKKVSLDFTITLHDKVYNRRANLETFAIDLEYETYADKDFVVFSAKNPDGSDFGCVAKVLAPSGSMEKSADTLSVRCADKVTIFAKTFVKKDKVTEIPNLMEELSKLKNSYEKMQKESAAKVAKRLSFGEFEIDGESDRSIEEEILSARVGKLSNNLFMKLFYFGKYLFEISKGNLNLCACGLVNGDYMAYASSTSNFLQLSRLYNFSLKTPRVEEMKVAFVRFFELLDDYKKNASRLFGIRGIFIPSIEAPESGLVGSVMPSVVLNINVAAQISLMIFKYYLATNDLDFIREKGFEIILETGNFYQEFLHENKNTKMMESPFGISPFSSPENFRSKGGSLQICREGLVDFMSAKVVFKILAQLCVVLGKEEKEIEKWEDLYAKIPDVEVDKSGLIKEYNSNVFETDNSSPHIAHLFPYNIGFKPFSTKREFETLVANTIRHRFAHATGQFASDQLSDMATALATCGEAADSFEVLKVMIKNFLSSNLVFNTDDIANMGVGRTSNFSSVNLDKNTALVQTVQNMFVNSSKNNIFLFQSLPASFKKGAFRNLMLDYEIMVDLEFNLRRGVLKLKLKSPRNTTVNLFLPRGVRKVKGTDVLVDKQNMVLNGLSLPSNKFVRLKIIFSNL